MNLKNALKKEIKPFLIETIGSFLVAVGIYNFAVNSQFPMTGFSGIALILYRLFDLPIGLTTIILNIPVAFLCYKLLGKTFFFRSVRCIIISSLMIDVLAPMLPVYQGNRMLSAICTGVLGGLGYAMIYMQNSSTGGADFIIMSVKAMRPHISVGKIAFLSDIGIIIIGGLIFKDMDGIIYGMIINFIFAIAVDKVLYGINSGKLTLIVTNKADEVTKIIEEVSDRGSTVIPASGGYQREEKDIIMCACNNKQMYILQKAVKEVDENSFVIILESNEVHGEGFKPIVLGEKGN